MGRRAREVRELCVVVLVTFTVVRIFDWCVPAARFAPGLSESSAAAGAHGLTGSRRMQLTGDLQGRVTEPRPGPQKFTRVDVAPLPRPAAIDAAAALSSSSAASAADASEYFIVIGFPVGIDQRNTERRQLLRDMWMTEYPNIGRTVRAEFLIGLLTYHAEGHDDKTVASLHREQRRYGDLALLNAREATRDPHRGDPKCTGEKIVAWFQRCTVLYASTKFFIKADWDTWIHAGRLEYNFRLLAAERPNTPLYIGNTLWCSYSLADYQPCGYGFGPLQAAGARAVECPKLPRGGQNAVGPFPYAAGLFWGLSYDVMRWIGGARLVNDFVRNASARFAPPYWVKGEDSAFGFFVHVSPFRELTPVHWGWQTLHDGWEFRSEKERGLCTQHISNNTLAVHSMHTVADFEFTRDELRRHCDSDCERRRLPFEVDGLRDLCGRNPKIPKVYSRCAAVGYPQADPASHGKLELTALPRGECRSVGKNVPFVADAAEGGTIKCEPSRKPSRWHTASEQLQQAAQ